MSEFTLHPQLAADTVFVADWALSRVLVMNDARFPWLILVPRRNGLREWYDLEAGALAETMEDVVRAGKGLKRITGADKINIGALGNMVPQLHIHIVARRLDDAAWPGPVWGHGNAIPYTADAMKEFVKAVRMGL